ncbi:uncharacterized protein LOC124160367 [Ischnura elegans]|uniref:uncharacterized protein LOC124160367 n=1 Tax=Ischnura elegans TaxID=197161 RepID=UPI001ED87813|nr:uncharacterized protein LOC124160367 [Ischnura elegans]
MWNNTERRVLSCSLHLVVALVVFVAATTVVSKPIMVPSGKIGPIVPPKPTTRRPILYPLRAPAPVHEYPDPALEPPEFNGDYNEIEPVGTYNSYPKKFGMQLRNPPPLPVGVYSPRTVAAISARFNQLAYQLSLKYPQYKLLF